FCLCFFAASESQRDSVTQPRVARSATLGKASESAINPEGVVAITPGNSKSNQRLPQPFQRPLRNAVVQAFQPAGSRDFRVPCFGTGDWKVARTRRQECLRHERGFCRGLFQG